MKTTERKFKPSATFRSNHFYNLGATTVDAINLLTRLARLPVRDGGEQKTIDLMRAGMLTVANALGPVLETLNAESMVAENEAQGEEAARMRAIREARELAADANIARKADND